MAEISGSVAIVTVEQFRAGEVTLRIVKVRGGATAAQARLAIGVNGYGGANLRVVPPLPDPSPAAPPWYSSAASTCPATRFSRSVSRHGRSITAAGP